MESGRHAPGPPGGLRGRTSECALLDDLVSAIRRGESRSLVLRGEAGIGKTALLEYLIASAPDATVVRAVGGQIEYGAGFRQSASAVRAATRPAREASGAAAAGHGDRVRLDRRPSPG